MSEQPSGDDIVTFGGPGSGPGRGRRRLTGRSRRAVIAAGVAAVAMLGGAGVAYAASSAGGSSSPSAKPAPSVTHTAVPCPKSQAPCPYWRRFGPPRRNFAPGGIAGPLIGAVPFGALHGQFVIAKAGGGYQTVDVQRGKVTSVSASSITVRSPDGFTASYAVTGATIVDAQRAGIGSVKTGDQVSLEAKVSGGKATAASISDLTRLTSGRKAFGFGAAW